MKKILYSKYNTHRDPKYRLRTDILEVDGKRFVEKVPLSSEGFSHIDNMIENRKRLSEVYKRIIPVSCEKSGNGVRFEFIEGTPLGNRIDYKNDDIKDIKDALCKILDIIFEFNDDAVKNGIVKYANIDSNISNFIKKDGHVYLIDYEWVEDSPVPIRFLRYRTLFFTYIDHMKDLGDRISHKEFLALFGFSQKEMNLYKRMEDAFQNTIHGHRRKYMYTLAYEKPVNTVEGPGSTLSALREEANSKQAHIFHLDGVITSKDNAFSQLTIQKNQLVNRVITLSRCLRHPSFAVSYYWEKLMIKLNRAKNIEKANKVEAEWIDYKRDLSGEYDYWIRKKESEEKYEETFSYNPLISVLVPVYNVETRLLTECVDSVLNQVYQNWELILVDDASPMESVREDLAKIEKMDDRIHVFYAEKNGGISATTNIALEKAKGEFIALLDCDDLLSVNALYENVKVLNENKDLDLIYSDEDKIDTDSTVRIVPNFKPDFSPDTLMTMMYICHLSLYRRELVNEVGGFRSVCDGAQDHDLALRVTEKTNKVYHIKKILYHWRMIKASTADSTDAKPYVVAAAKKAKEDAMYRRGYPGFVEEIPKSGISRVVYDVKGYPLVSIIIPSKDHPNVLKKCLESMHFITTYKGYEVIVVDNGSSDKNRRLYEEITAEFEAKYIYQKDDFNFSKMCNAGVKEARGEYLLFLNDDIEIIKADWLTRMLGVAQLPHVGAVGAKLLYPDGFHIQHVGVANLQVSPVHLLHMFDDKGVYYYNQNKADFDVLAVTAACLLVKREKFEAVNGFDESFAVAYNDVDLCFKLYEAGWYNVIRNDAELIHHESLSRGYDINSREKTLRMFGEMERLYAAHPSLDRKDPFYSPFLNQLSPDFGLNLDGDFEFTCKEYNGHPKMWADFKIAYGINKKEVNWGVHINGFFLTNLKNDVSPIDIILENENGTSVILNTKRMYRPDLKDSFPEVPFASFSGFKTSVHRRFIEDGSYRISILFRGKKYQTGEEILVGVKGFGAKNDFAYCPKFSFVVPLYNTQKVYLDALLASLCNQTYTNFEICLADGSDMGIAYELQPIVSKYKAEFPDIKYIHLPVNRGIADNTNDAINFAEGEYIVFVDHDDTIEPDSLYEFTKAINENREIDVLYSDQDFLNSEGTATFGALLKPDFNLDFLRSGNYISHLFAVKKELLDDVGKLDSKYDGSQDFDLTLRLCERAKKVYHVKKVLYHWRLIESSTAANPESKSYAYENGKKAIEAHLERMGIPGRVSMTENLGKYRVDYDYDEECLVFIDNGLVPVNEDAIEHMKGIASRPDVGYVGGKIVSKDNTLYHVGINIENGEEDYIYQGKEESYLGSMERIAAEVDYDAVSDRCMVVKKSVYEKYPDCAGAKAAGLLNVYTGFAVFKESE